MTLTKEKIEALAPDQASLSAALKLMKPASWPQLAAHDDGNLLWGECQGSGSAPYRVIVSPADVGYKCTCPSRKFPCKHVLAVMWMRVAEPQRFTGGTQPEWVTEWLSRRRPGSGRPATKPTEAASGAGASDKPLPSIEAALATEVTDATANPGAIARAEAQRSRIRAEREATILAGLDELDRWIEDQLGAGLASFPQRADLAARTLSRRLVDAKAGGLSGRLDALAADLYRYPEDMRADVAMERLGALALISAAYRHQDRLPAPLLADVRRSVGWTQKRDELLDDTSALRIASRWIVAATLSVVQPDKLRRLETWLLDSDPKPGAPRAGVLVDFVPVAAGHSASPFIAGETIDGEVVFYPSAAPLRGLLASRASATAEARWPEMPPGLSIALDGYDRALASLPWLESWPIAASALSMRPAGRSHLALVDPAGVAIPVERDQSEALLPMLGLDGIAALLLWDGRFARVLAADTPAGRWHEG